MASDKDLAKDFQETHARIKKLFDEDRIRKHGSKPFANQFLIHVKAEMENELSRKTFTDAKHRSRVTALLACSVVFTLTFAEDTDDFVTVEQSFKECKEIIGDNMTEPEFIVTTLTLYNTYSLRCSSRDLLKSITLLKTSESYYLKFKESGQLPVDTSSLFKSDVEYASMNKVESLYTQTVYYLAQCYQMLGDDLKSAVYCHVTLKRQIAVSKHDLDAIDWALNAATLSQFFVERNGFKQARHHLAAASYLLDLQKNALSEVEFNQKYEEETFRHRCADVALCWAKYGLILLEHSKTRLMEDDGTLPCLEQDLKKLSTDPDIQNPQEILAEMKFDIDLSSYENQISDRFVLILDDAKKVFTNILKWLKEAQNYYSLNSLASDYIQIVQDQSTAYRRLAFFEENPDNKAKMHKRRIDCLESLIKEINPVYYMDYCRQIWFELGECYNDIADIKRDKLKATKDQRPTPQTLTKINSLIDKSIQNFNNLFDSFKGVNKQEEPLKIDEIYEFSFLWACYYTAALYGKYITLDQSVQKRNKEKSLQCYQKLLAYYEANPHVECELGKEQIALTKEMCEVLPLAIESLTISDEA